jgi:putative ubiquitin-RnfH superfamily antitoxin RatB of RatAB toxin-antitoxin module
LGITVRDGGLVRQAAAAGGIRYVQTVDVRRTNLLGIYVRSLTVVTGE